MKVELSNLELENINLALKHLHKTIGGRVKDEIFAKKSNPEWMAGIMQMGAEVKKLNRKIEKFMQN